MMQLPGGLMVNGERRRDLGFRARVGDGNRSPTRSEKARGGLTGLPQPDDQRFPALVSHRNFNVLSANKAQTRPAIQKRTITFDSGQPICSKW